MIYVAYLCVMATLKIETVLTLEDGTVVKNSGNYTFSEDENKVIALKFISANEGGPIMRPNNPPTW